MVIVSTHLLKCHFKRKKYKVQDSGNFDLEGHHIHSFKIYEIYTVFLLVSVVQRQNIDLVSKK
jgi:hypothetical protein